MVSLARLFSRPQRRSVILIILIAIALLSVHLINNHVSSSSSASSFLDGSPALGVLYDYLPLDSLLSPFASYHRQPGLDPFRPEDWEIMQYPGLGKWEKMEMWNEREVKEMEACEREARCMANQDKVVIFGSGWALQAMVSILLFGLQSPIRIRYQECGG
jgi:hypothetical protein